MPTTKEDEVICYILMRTDLNMSPGKMVAQGGHAVQYMCMDPDLVRDKWFWDWQESSTKVVLSVNKQELEDILAKLDEYEYIINPVIDSGRTEIAPNTLTCASIQPLPRKIAKEFVGHLKLLK